jgi:hypothetical protein
MGERRSDLNQRRAAGADVAKSMIQKSSQLNKRSYRTIKQTDDTYTVEILDGLDIVEKVRGFLDRGGADTWTAAEQKRPLGRTQRDVPQEPAARLKRG